MCVNRCNLITFPSILPYGRVVQQRKLRNILLHFIIRLTLALVKLCQSMFTRSSKIVFHFLPHIRSARSSVGAKARIEVKNDGTHEMVAVNGTRHWIREHELTHVDTAKVDSFPSTHAGKSISFSSVRFALLRSRQLHFCARCVSVPP